MWDALCKWKPKENQRKTYGQTHGLKEALSFWCHFVVQGFKWILHVDVFPFLNFYSQDDWHRFRQVDDYSLKTNFARTSTFKNTYFNRIVEMWNLIPLDIRLSPSCAVFKWGMKKFLSEEWIFDLKIFF